MDVNNKIVVVTGASSGIGLATTKLLTKRGAKLALVSRSKEKLEALSKELPESIAIPADMTKPNEIKRMVEQTMDHFGRIDILVNNAGVISNTPRARRMTASKRETTSPNGPLRANDFSAALSFSTGMNIKRP